MVYSHGFTNTSTLDMLIGFSSIHTCSSKADELISLPHCLLMFFNVLVESVFCLADIGDWAASTCNPVQMQHHSIGCLAFDLLVCVLLSIYCTDDGNRIVSETFAK